MKDLISRIHTREVFSWKEFAGENDAFQPAYTWVWNAPIERGEVRKQLDGMRSAGIRTVYILPEPENFRVYNERIHMEQEYLSADFFAELRYAIEYALSIGMNCWMYDEGGWPSGSACGKVIAQHPELCRKNIAAREIHLSAGEEYQPGDRVIAAFRIDPAGGLTMTASGERVENDCVLSEYYVQWHGGMVVDSLDEEIGRAFVESTHEKYKEYLGDLFAKTDENGNLIPGSGRLPMMFTDEPGAGPYAWPRGFEKRFREAYGYDIAPFVPVILDGERDADDAGEKARIDYRELAGEMFREHYFKPIHEWCRVNHVLSTGHLDIDHRTDGCMIHNYGSVLNQLRELDVPGVDVIWEQITRPKENEAPCEEGNGFFERFASSAASQSGGKFAVSESFAVYGAGLVGEEMRYVLNHQLVRGINLFNFMSMSYGKTDAVPMVMRPAFLSEMPGFEHLRSINDYTARACYLMQLGESGVRTALYLPNRDIWAAGECGRRAVEAFDRLGQQLEARQIEFDVIDDEGLRKTERVGNELRLGRARYKCILAPECAHMPEDVRKIVEGISGEASPAVECSCSSIRVRTRVMEDGSVLYMLFNESGRTIKTDVRLLWDGYVCRLDAENARAEKAQSILNELTLDPGKAQFYLCRNEPLAEAVDSLVGRRLIAETDQFVLRKIRNTWLDEKGIHDRRHDGEGVSCGLGSWEEILGNEYSGEAAYCTQMALEEPMKAGRLYELALGRVECSARVTINGTEAGIAWAEPKRVLFDGAIAQGKRELIIEIEVANTLANQFNAQPLEKWYPAEELGPYQERLKALEANAPTGGLYGPVTLNELIMPKKDEKKDGSNQE